jgi:FKBP-type peptidyl-prolyl cis-trans isomerase
MNKFFGIVSLVLLVACSPSGVEKEPVKKEAVAKQLNIDGSYKVVADKRLENGLSFAWYKKGKGAKLTVGDLVMIDYKVKLKDGSVVDGNHLLKRAELPFLVGFNMQTTGWDLAFEELNVGDFVRVIIPAELARGEVGVEGLIPPNADNILYVKIIRKVQPNRIVEGTKVWLLEENKSNKLKFNKENKISIHFMASSQSNRMFINTFRTNQPFSFFFKAGNVVPGLKKALINAKTSDRLFVLVPPSEAYGTNGLIDLVKPNESVFYNIMVMDVLKN